MSAHPKYKSLRLREEEYQKIKELQKYLRKMGTSSVDLQELRRQNIIDLPDDEDEGFADNLSLGFVLGLGAAALAYLIWKRSQK